MKELLITHAERYLEDFWAGWYQHAANECLDAAEETLPEALTALLKTTKETRDVRSQARMEITASPAGFQRNQQAFLSPKVIRSGSLPKGEATIWLALKDNARDYIQDPSQFRRPISTASDQDPERFTLKRVMNDSQDPMTLPPRVNAVFNIFYRGHQWPGPVSIDPRIPRGPVVTYIPTKSVGKVVMRGVDRRPIVFILDCSGSMKSKMFDALGNETTRFEIAKKRLTEALSEIAILDEKNKQRTEVGLIIFGLQNKEMNQPSVNTLAEIKPLNDVHLKFIIDQLRKIILNRGGTPLLRAMNTGSSLLPVDRPGTIVAITDGADSENDSYSRNLSKLKSDINERRNKGNEIDQHIVGFNVQTLKQAEKNKLRSLQNELQAYAKFTTADTGQALLAELREATKSRPYSVLNSSIFSAEKQVPLDDSIELNSESGFQIRFGSLKSEPFDIAGGELIEFEYEYKYELGKGRLKHVKPDLLLRAAAQPPVAAEKQRWSFGYQKYEVIRQTASFELSLLHDGNQFVPRPKEIHFDIHPPGDLSKRSFTWRILEGQSVPTWKVEVFGWPATQQAEIETVWKMKRTEPELTISPAKAWDGQPDPITLNASDSGSLDLTLTSSWKNAEQLVTIELQLELDQFQGRTRRIWIDVFPRTRVELAKWNNGNWVSEDRSFSIELIQGKENHDLIFQFMNLPANFNPDDWAILVTSWKSLKNGSYKLQKPLKINKPSNE